MMPMDFIKMIQQGQNPQQLMLNYLKAQASQNPMSANLLNLAQNNKTREIEQIVRNMFQSRGLDFDKEFKAFREQYRL